MTPTTPHKPLGEQLAEARQAAGLSVAQAAAELAWHILGVVAL